MTDIVERLRDGNHCTVGCSKLRAEAAAADITKSRPPDAPAKPRPPRWLCVQCGEIAVDPDMLCQPVLMS